MSPSARLYPGRVDRRQRLRIGNAHHARRSTRAERLATVFGRPGTDAPAVRGRDRSGSGPVEPARCRCKSTGRRDRRPPRASNRNRQAPADLALRRTPATAPGSSPLRLSQQSGSGSCGHAETSPAVNRVSSAASRSRASARPWSITASVPVQSSSTVRSALPSLMPRTPMTGRPNRAAARTTA